VTDTAELAGEAAVGWVVAAEAGAGVLGGPSLKAALDCDWDDPAARERAIWCSG